MSPWRSAVMPSGLKDPGGNDAKRSTRPRSQAAASSGIRTKQATRNKAARKIADISPPRKIVGAASLSLQRRSVKKAVLKKERPTPEEVRRSSCYFLFRACFQINRRALRRRPLPHGGPLGGRSSRPPASSRRRRTGGRSAGR